MSAWGKADNKSVSGTVTLTAPAITFNGATGHAAGVYTSAAHPFQLGDPVAYANGGGTSVVGLTSGSTYYVTNVTTNTFMVAASEADALHNNPTVIASTDGVGASHTFTLSLDYGRATLTGSGTNFDPALAVGDVVRVGDQEMIAIAVASDTVATVINANPGTVLTVFSAQEYTISEKPTSIASISTTDFQSTQVFGVDNTEIAAGGDNVASVALIQGGARYLEVPPVTFSGGGGASAAATASIAGGLVTAVAVTNTGSSYETVPTVAIAKPRRVIPTSGITAATDTIAYTAHGLVANEEVKYNNGGGTSATGLTSGTTYYVIASGLTVDAFKVSATDGGTAISFPYRPDLASDITLYAKWVIDPAYAAAQEAAQAEAARVAAANLAAAELAAALADELAADDADELAAFAAASAAAFAAASAAAFAAASDAAFAAASAAALAAASAAALAAASCANLIASFCGQGVANTLFTHV